MANKLELTWYGKEIPINVEPRILIENPQLSYQGKTKKEQPSLFDSDDKANCDNMLIHGDNLLALKALEKDFAGKIKCIYIDPPYNTGYAFTHYDDNLEHSIWLSLMKPRLEILRTLLKEDGGSIWISIDADEQAYLKVLCDEVFGRKNFIDEIVWQRSYAPVNLKKTLSRSHDYILVYAKNNDIKFELNKLPRTVEQNKDYKNPDNDYRGPWKVGNPSVGPAVEKNIYEIIAPSGRVELPPKGRSWLYSKERFEKLLKDNRIWFGTDGNNIWAPKMFLSEVRDGVVAQTLWTYNEVGHTQDAKREIKAFNFDTVFDTPKPEKLLERIITLGSDQGDIVLDSFLGSGTTAAVAQKMNRRWIGIEMGDHAYTHCKMRLDRVIDGTDQGGISKSVNWQGGGGYKFYELAPSLIQIDAFGQAVINKEYNAEMLASAVALHEGYIYAPDASCYFKQASNETNSFLYVTTRHINKEIIDSVLAELKAEEYLVIVCKSYDNNADEDAKNITIKKIPQSLLDNCEFGVDNYNLNIIHPPVYQNEEDDIK